jgi:4-amino-4-deoxy-L-arabinose transferase-like glycosyltransferase
MRILKDNPTKANNDRILTIIPIILPIILAIGLKVWLLSLDVVPFNADEAVVGLMARHILSGERPIFFYGQIYMGSLDACLVALGFWIFGQHIWVIRMLQILLYGLTLLTTIYLGKSAFKQLEVGILAAWLLAIPAINVTLYTTASLGGYGEVLLIGNLILLVTLRLAVYCDEGKYFPHWWMIWGFLVGLGLWVLSLTLVYSIPSGIYLVIILLYATRENKLVKRVQILSNTAIYASLGFIIGSAPWWIFAAQNGFDKLLFELLGASRAGIEGLSYGFQLGRHLLNLILFGLPVIFGFRPPWDIQWLGLPLLPFVLFLWIAVVIKMVKGIKDWHTTISGKSLLVALMAVLLLSFILTPFGADPSGRYFLPLTVPLSLFLAEFIIAMKEKWGSIAWGLFGLVLIYQGWGTYVCAKQYPPGITTQFSSISQHDMRSINRLVEFLYQNGETRGYTNYWIAYPLAFRSSEQIIFAPWLPYHLDFRYSQDRYPKYGEIVELSDRAAFITSHHPQLDARLRSSFQELGVQWREAKIGDFQVFYGLTRRIRFDEIKTIFSQSRNY